MQYYQADILQGTNTDILQEQLPVDAVIIEGLEGALLIAPDKLELSGIGPWRVYELEEVDWYRQWRDHVQDFDGESLKLDCNGQTLSLVAGAGFGDFSHPTTQLSMRLLKDQVFGKCVVDMGSGSGILSFASSAWGAKSVSGIEIDPKAIEHAMENLSLNPWVSGVSFSREFSPEGSYVLLMNMISSEQKIVLKTYSKLLSHASKVIVSGVRKDERERYLELWAGWELVEELEESDWLAFLFA